MPRNTAYPQTRNLQAMLTSEKLKNRSRGKESKQPQE